MNDTKKFTNKNEYLYIVYVCIEYIKWFHYSYKA